MNLFNAFVASIMITSSTSLAADDHKSVALHLANPGEWIHIQLQPLDGEKRPIYEIWDSVLKDNGFYQIAVPVKSGNRSVRHVAYNPKTKARFKYHILFDLGYRFKMQFEEYEATESPDLINVNFDMQKHGVPMFEFIPPDYCIDGTSQATFQKLEIETKQSLLEKNGCDPKSYDR